VRASRDHEKPIGRIARHRRERFVKTLGFAYAERQDCEAQCLGGRRGHLISLGHATVGRVVEHRHLAERRHRLFEQLQTLCGELVRQVRHAGEIAARPAGPYVGPLIDVASVGSRRGALGAVPSSGARAKLAPARTE
jgi:hypothetical protein